MTASQRVALLRLAVEVLAMRDFRRDPARALRELLRRAGETPIADGPTLSNLYLLIQKPGADGVALAREALEVAARFIGAP
jgi:hypothetical protein